LIEALTADIDTAPIDKRFKPIFKFLKKLTLTSSKMTQADADAIFAEGWDERALHDVVMVCCCFSFMNRLADGHGLPSDPKLFAARAKRHAEEGYLAQYIEETGG
jgi:alkylhydroperoxidase family enzyme